MAVERDLYRVPVDKFIDLLVIREIIIHKKTMNEIHTRYLPGTPDCPAINSLQFDDTVGIPQGKRKRGTVEIDNHAGDGGIDICSHPVPEPEDNAGHGITIIPEILITEKKPRADVKGGFYPAVGDRYQERKTFFHHYQQMDCCRDILLRVSGAALRTDQQRDSPVPTTFPVTLLAVSITVWATR